MQRVIDWVRANTQKAVIAAIVIAVALTLLILNLLVAFEHPEPTDAHVVKEHYPT